MIPSDTDLIARVRRDDDHAAFRELVQRHQSAVRHFLRHLTGGEAALADDLAQETFLQAYRGLSRFAGTAKFSTWLLGIAHNHWRNSRRRTQPVPLETAALDALESTPATVASSDLRHDLAQALRQLGPEEQAAVHLHYHQGLTHGEMAEVLRWPLGTVKTHLARAKEKLRLLLAPWNPQT